VCPYPCLVYLKPVLPLPPSSASLFIEKSAVKTTSLPISASAAKTAFIIIPLSLNTRYLFFLRILDKENYDLNGYKSASIYAGVAEPWRFKINADETVNPETLLTRLYQYFPPQTLESIVEAMDQSYTPGQKINAYPPPQVEAPLIQTPYP